MGDKVKKAVAAAREMWLQQDFYDQRIPGLDDRVNHPRWRGLKLRKFPTDMILYSQVIYKNRPDFIIECGSAEGGSALFFGDMLGALCNSGTVISIDIRSPKAMHPLVEFWERSSVDDETIEMVKKAVGRRSRVMVSLDSDHNRRHVLNELRAYSKIVTTGQYLVCEDTYRRGRRLRRGPGDAIKQFLEEGAPYKMEHIDNQFYYGSTRGGWLKKQ